MEPITDDEDFLELVELVEAALHRNPRIFRPRVNHFNKWSEEEFYDRFRLTKYTVQDICNQINISSVTKRNKALSSEDMLLLTLRYYATGSMLIVASDFSGVHKSTASRVINKVSRAIASFKNRYIQFPETEEDITNVCLGFYKKAKFPKCIGAVDCTHIKIQSPGGDNAEVYRNRKGYFSMNVQCIYDASLYIRNIVCRWPGSTHDSTIFNMSRVRARFENNQMGGNVLVGDSGYANRSFLITPLASPSTPAEHLFNESQIRTRNPIERLFGIWKRRFPILALGIRLSIEKVEAIVVATAVLHNIACKNSEPPPPPLNDEVEAVIMNEMNNINLPIENAEDNINENEVTRRALIDNYFSKL